MPQRERPQILNLVIVSPGDVLDERDAVNKVVENLNRHITPQLGLELRALRWETDTYPGFHPLGPQGQVDATLGIDTCDIMLGIFWRKFGTPVRDARSGTEHELKRAYKAWQASKGERPHIMVYFRDDRNYVPKDAAEKRQWARVTAFKKALSKDALWSSYKERQDFEQVVREHLLMFLARNAGRLGGKSYTVVRSSEELRAHNKRIISEAQQVLFTTGSRSRDIAHLRAIEKRLKEKGSLVHYRVLFGPPYHQMLKEHLAQLLKIRKPEDRTHGYKTIFVGLFDDYSRQFESFILGNEKEAIVILPSFLGLGQFDSGIIFTGPDELDGLFDFVKQLYEGSQKLETPKSIAALKLRNAEA